MDATQNEYEENGLVVSNSISAHLEVSRILDDLRGAAIGISDRSIVMELYATPSETGGDE